MSRPIPSAVLATLLVVAFTAGSAFAQSNLTVLEHIADHPFYSEVWGYAAPDGTELCIVGLLDGVSFIDATDPTRPGELTVIPGPVSVVRDIKTYDTYAYIVNETGGGLQIVDLSDPTSPTLVKNDATYFQTGHNLHVDAATGLLYVAGSNVGLLILDLADPENPVIAGESFTYLYVHDLVVRDGIAWLAAVDAGKLASLDVSGLPVTSLRDMVITADQATHNVWLTGDGRHALTTDEVPGGHIQIFDVSNPDDLRPVTEWVHPDDPTATVHNVVVHEDLAYVAWYKAGLQILDIKSPQFPQRVGFYDTHPDSGGGLNGAWGVYPFQPSGTIYVSDMETGVWLLEFDPDYGVLRGVITDSATGLPLEDVAVKTLDGDQSCTTNDSGVFKLSLSTGVHDIVCERYGYATDNIQVTINQGTLTVQNAGLVAVPSGSVSGSIQALGPGAPLEGAALTLEGTPLGAVTATDGSYRFDQVPAGTYTLTADRFGYAPVVASVTVVADQEAVRDLGLPPAVFVDDLESAAGWTVGAPGDNATAGWWELGDPEGTGCGTVQPEDDHTPDPGSLAFVTGAAAGAWMGSHDVDGGVTTLMSPVLDLAGVSNPVLRYHRWFSNDAGANPAQDTFLAEASDDGGSTWATLEAITDSREFWEQMEFRLADFIVPGNQVQIRFVVGDLNGGSIVEAGIDDVEIHGSFAVGVPRDPGPGPALRVYPANPNPILTTTSIRFELPGRGPVHAGIYDARGRRVAILSESVHDAGGHELRWDGRTATGFHAPAGVYFFRLAAAGRIDTQKLVLTR